MCLTNLIASYNEMTSSVGERGAVDIFYLNFSNALDTVCYSILIGKLMKYRLGKWTVR